MRRDLLDEVANQVVLPQQRWEIARLLRVQSELRAEQARARSGVVTAELETVLGPQEEALRVSERALGERVARLEEYAARVRIADAALRARDALGRNEKYVELLAMTDDVEGVRGLSAGAAELAALLTESVREAVVAGRALRG